MIETHNARAEFDCLQHIANDKSGSLLTLMKDDWFWIENHRQIFKIFKERGSLNHYELESQLNAKDINIDPETVDLLYTQPFHSFEQSVKVVESKYLQRITDSALDEAKSLIYHHSPVEIALKLGNFFDRIKERVEPLKSITDDFTDENLDLLDFGGIRSWDKLIPLRKSIIILGGESSHHKTNQALDALVTALEVNYPKNPRFKVMFFSGEMSFNRIRERLFARVLKIELSKIMTRGNEPGKISAKELVTLMEEKYPHFITNFIIVPGSKFRNAQDLSRLVNQYRPDVCALDFIQYFAQLSAGNASQQNQNVMEAVTTIKILAEVYNSLWFVVSQIRKKDENSRIFFPRINDLEWSGLIKQIADSIGLCFWPWKIKEDVIDQWCYFTAWAKVRDGAPFMEYLRVNPEICSFFRHPDEAMVKKYTKL